MDGPFPFMSLFSSIYPVQRAVDLTTEPSLVGLLIKSVMHDREQNSLLCRTMALHGPGRLLYRTFTMRVKNISPVVGYDLELCDSSTETWEKIKSEWSPYMRADPVELVVRQDDIKMSVNAQVFPLVSVAQASRYMATVEGALTFGDFSEKGHYISRGGNVPALCCGVMFGRVYFLPEVGIDPLSRNIVVSPGDLIYDHAVSESSALGFETKLSGLLFNAACLNIETVSEERYRAPMTRCRGFALQFPQCTESKVETLTALALALERELSVKVTDELGGAVVSIPTLPADAAGQQQEIVCMSLVLLRGGRPREQGRHRKTLMVFYNNGKVNGPELDRSAELALTVGIKDPGRIMIVKCDSEFHLLCQVLIALTGQEIELLYMYNVGFDLRVLEQRVCFYESPCCEQGHFGVTRGQGRKLRTLWDRMFVSEAFGSVLRPVFEFETPRLIGMYESMLMKMRALTAQAYVEAKVWFKSEKNKIGHFKMNSCGTNVIDLCRMVQTPLIKSGCLGMKVGEVAPHVVDFLRSKRGEPPKDPTKLRKVSHVSHIGRDEMIKRGGEELFKVVLNTLVDSQLCARLARVLDPVSSLFHRCRSTLNTDVIVHGRCNTFDGFVQSIHAVQVAQLKYKLDNLRCAAGPKGRELRNRVPWAMALGDDVWQGGSVCDPMTGLHYSGPGMGLELTFDFASMYPSIMSALNISPETTVPWPPNVFDHDLSDWLCYNWEAEGFKCASLIMKYDRVVQRFVRDDGIMNASMERYYERRARCKQQLKTPGLSEDKRAYLELQVLECKILMNSFYGTAGACGPLISAAGRQQFSVVRGCTSEFFGSKNSALLYGDTDSFMTVVGYGPRDEPELELEDRVEDPPPGTEAGRLAEFAARARAAAAQKLARSERQVPAFRGFVHRRAIEDMLGRLYVIGHMNSARKAFRDPAGAQTMGFTKYLVRMSDGSVVDITEPFVENIRINLEYENSSSITCHQNKKMYLSLSHTAHPKTGEPENIKVKVRGISACTTVRAPPDTGMSEAFIACVMRGDCLKLQSDSVHCFSTTPWHRLRASDCVLFNRNKINIDRVTGLWPGVAQAATILSRHVVELVKVIEFDAGFSATAVTLRDLSSSKRFQVMTLYKDKLYCLNHLFSSAEAIRRDLLTTRAAELVSSQTACGFFLWRRLLKCSKNTGMRREVLSRLKVERSSIKTSYLETLMDRDLLQRITGLSCVPSIRPGDEKVGPCEAAFYRYPLDLNARAGCLMSMFGTCALPQCSETDVELDNMEGASIPETARGSSREVGARGAVSSSDTFVPSPSCCHSGGDDRGHVIEAPSDKGGGAADWAAEGIPATRPCELISRVLLAREADRSLLGRHSKLAAYCIMDYCLPRYMYSRTHAKERLAACSKHLFERFTGATERLERANAVFLSIMNNCPQHMIPCCGQEELESIDERRTTLCRLPVDKAGLVTRVVVEDMGLDPERVYKSSIAAFGSLLTKALREGAAVLTADRVANQGCVSVGVPRQLLDEAGVRTSGTWISLSAGECDHGMILDMAGCIYQAVLVKHVYQPEAFPAAAETLPHGVLYIMPFSNRDPRAVQRWLFAFGKMEWLDKPGPQKAPVARRTCPPRPKYHCVGCESFFRQLAILQVPLSELEKVVYDDVTKRRRFGMCLNEISKQ